MSTAAFYHYLPSGEFVRDRFDSIEPEYQPKKDTGGMAIRTLYQLENLSDIFISSEEEEDDTSAAVRAMKKLDLDGIPLPKMVWTSTRFKPSQVAQFISLMQNKNYKLPKAAKESGIEYDMAYRLNKQWKTDASLQTIL